MNVLYHPENPFRSLSSRVAEPTIAAFPDLRCLDTLRWWRESHTDAINKYDRLPLIRNNAMHDRATPISLHMLRETLMGIAPCDRAASLRVFSLLAAMH